MNPESFRVIILLILVFRDYFKSLNMGNFKESVQLIFRSFRRFVSLSFILLSMILLIRLYEFLITSNYANYPSGSYLYLVLGLKFDLILYLRISAVLMIPFLLIALFSQKAAKTFFVVFSILLIFGNMLLLQYFATARVPLGADLFGYSLNEIKHTVATSGSINILPYILMGLFLVFMIRVFIKHVYYRIKPWALGILAILMFGSLLQVKFLNPSPSNYKNEFGMFVAINKLNFFAQSVTNHYLYKGKLDKEPYTFLAETESAGTNSFEYIDADYPFLHKENTPDILGEYFEMDSVPPNFVFVIVESLGRAYSGDGAYLGSFTPFLDSLMGKSLYWENCLSTSGRTFQVLPTLLASVPFGKNGFAELGNQMPDHLSLISILKKESDYSSSFLYGGDAGFDKMDVFLNRQGIDQIIDIEKFGNNYEKLPATPNGFTWGYGDREIFRRYIQDLKENQKTPRVDVMLTLAMHTPFLVPDEDSYIRKFHERLKTLEISEETKNNNLNYENEFASVIYFDESFRYFMDEFKKLPQFANTIFIITGDHRMPEIPISTQLDRFHVPLIIYSPLLKKAEKFSSVVTHFDITPSFIALLNSNRFINRPTVASWVGHGLDNSTEFRSLHEYPLMRNKNEILDLVDSVSMYSNNTVYEMYSNLYIEPVDDTAKKAKLKGDLDNFIRRNNYACLNNKLIPDSLFKYSFKR